MGRHLAVGANSFARKWFVQVGRANEFAPTTEDARAVYDERIDATLSRQLIQGCGKVQFSKAFSYGRIVYALHAQLPDGTIVKQAVSLLHWETATQAAYCKRIVATLSQELTHCYNRGEWGVVA